ncbi:MAG: YbaK/EbsC family protein [Erysipelotrichaceae bacterium]|jgi:prolyl-tRNA editing enzyme YbaK/EbsC (Cys-tRNA(Pro) deacylase)|nr:YbaK/EbsC family protein [Erysipelotrichaceae bacterium]
MSIDTVRAYLKTYGLDQNIIELSESSATVDLAAKALGTKPQRIAKTLSLKGKEGAFVVVVAGDARIDNHKFKDTFQLKAKMLNPDEVLEFTTHPVGGVCPFALPEGVDVYLDESLKRFETVFPACGSGNSAIELTLPQLENASRAKGWVDVCQLPI